MSVPRTAAPPRATRRVRPAAAVSLAFTTVLGLVLCVLTAVGSSAAAPASLTSNPARPDCGYGSGNWAPNCGRLVGVAPLAHTYEALSTALPKEESWAGRSLDIVHAYHTNDDLFPTTEERNIALATGHQHLLLLNWKPATDMSWAAVAAGKADARIDRLAKYVTSTFRHYFFLDIWHEPENDVRPTAGSGYTADDYAAMYRHVVSRLRADGLTWAITVMNYMGFEKWTQQSWFTHLWPGSSYVSWVAIDPYGTGASTTTWTANNFPTLVNRPLGSFPGFYNWITRMYPGKPIMLAEWGVAGDPKDPGGQARFFNDVVSTIGKYPMLKALVYFGMPHPPPGQPYTYVNAEGSGSLNAYRAMLHNPALVAPAWRYGS